MGAARRAVLAGVVTVLVALGLMSVPTVASAATGDVGYVGSSYSGASDPTADKPQSKLWFTDGRWWANMFDTVSQDWHIFYLDRAAEKWVDTKVAVDTRPTTSSDALWDGQYLYIGTHGVRSGTTSSSTSTPMRLYRYTYDSTNKKFVISSGFPKTISQNSSESLTIDRDSKGTVWATWTKVSGTSNQVMVNSGTSNGSTWGTPFVVPTTGGLNNANVNPNVAVDDISTLVAFGQNKIGLLWSNQSDDTVYWSVHADGAPTNTWTGGVAVKGNKMADDHLNIKSIQADTSGRVFAAVKTSLDHLSGAPNTSPQINLLTYKPGTGAGTWSSTTFGTIKDCHTRPQVVLDESSNKVYVFATGTTGTGTCSSNGDGAIYMKSSSMDAPQFSSGVGTMIMRDAASETLNNVTTTKQSATSASGIVVLASNDATHRYWHADVVGGSGTPTPAPTAAPTANFTYTPTSGPAPLAVSFTDTSTGSPTSWAWDFGDGATSTAQNPSHTYTTAGTYTAKLTATNASGSNAASKTVTVTGGTTDPGASGSVTAGQSTQSSNAAAVTSVAIPKPGDVRAGDVLIAQITADATPSVSAAPAGWSTVISPRSVSTSARLFAYYHVVTDPASEPASYSWTLSTAVKWNAGMANFHGVDTSVVWDTAASGATVTTSASTITVPGVTTTKAGAMLVGGVGLNSSTVAVTQPSGWSEAVESTGAQVTEVASQARPTVGATGNATWTLGSNATSTGWVRALRPA